MNALTVRSIASEGGGRIYSDLTLFIKIEPLSEGLTLNQRAKRGGIEQKKGRLLPLSIFMFKCAFAVLQWRKAGRAFERRTEIVLSFVADLLGDFSYCELGGD